MATEKKRKRVRKDDKHYEHLIFAAFETESILTQQTIITKTNEPWNFLKPIIEKLCTHHSNNQKPKSFILKPEYRLSTDQSITTTTTHTTTIIPPPNHTTNTNTIKSPPNTNPNTTTNTNIKPDTTTEPPKKKRKKGKSNFWLVKIPNWIADEWFDDTKYPNCSRLGELYVIPDKSDDNKKTMKLEVTRPHPQINNNRNDNYKYKHNQFDNIPIPSQFKMDQRAQRNRVNVKHGELTITGQDKLLVFHDKPPFPVGSHVEALDNSRNINNNNNNNNEDIDIKMKDKKDVNAVTIKGYNKGIIKEINNDRTFTVQFNKTKKQRYKVPERDIRFENPQEAARANKCKIWGVVNGEMDVTPQWTPQYKKYLQLRSMKRAFQHTMQIKEKRNIFNASRAERDRDAMAKIHANRKLDKKNVKSNKNKDVRGKKRVKNVRKDEEVYKNMVFAAFEKESCLTQKDMESKTGEPWNFLRPIVQKICDRHQNTNKGGRSWILKAEFRLATDVIKVDDGNNNEQK